MSETEECRCQRKDAPPLDHWSGCPVWKKFFADKPAPVEKSEGPELADLIHNDPKMYAAYTLGRRDETHVQMDGQAKAYAEGQKSERVKLLAWAEENLDDFDQIHLQNFLEGL